MWPQHNCRGNSTTEWCQMKSSWSKVTQGRAEPRRWWTDKSTLKSVRSFVSILWLRAQKFSQLLNNSQQGLRNQQPWSKSVSCYGWAWKLPRAGGWQWWWRWCGFGCYLYYWQMIYIYRDSARTKTILTIVINIKRRSWKFVANKLGNGHWSGVLRQGLAPKLMKPYFMLGAAN